MTEVRHRGEVKVIATAEGSAVGAPHSTHKVLSICTTSYLNYTVNQFDTK